MSRNRSPSHPDVALPKAIELAKKLHSRIYTNPVDRESAVRDLGYSGLTGASGKMLANLLHFGLLEKAGKGQVKVSQLGIDVLYSEGDDRKKALHRAGFSPAFYQEIKESWKDGVPSENWLRNLMMKRGFSGSAVDPAISSYLETCSYLQQEGAYESHGAPPPPPIDSSQIDDEDGDDPMEAPTVEVQAARPQATRPTGSAAEHPVSNEERVVFIEEGEPGQRLKLIALGDVSDDMLEALEDYVKRQRKRLQRSD